jgi:hypothetical protein
MGIFGFGGKGGMVREAAAIGQEVPQTKVSANFRSNKAKIHCGTLG